MTIIRIVVVDVVAVTVAVADVVALVVKTQFCCST